MPNLPTASTSLSAAPVAAAALAPSRYATVAVVLHWLIALLVLSTMPLGWFSTSPRFAAPRPAAQGPEGVAPAAGLAQPGLPGPAASQPQPGGARPMPPPKSAAQRWATDVHKPIGILILCLTLVRIGWRLGHKPPPLPASMARPLRWAARASHSLFYLLLVAMPMSGWWLSSAVPNKWRHTFGFGFFDVPFLPVVQSGPAAFAAKFVHSNLAWLMAGLLVLHVLAALKHHFADKDDVLRRMLPRRFS